MLRNLVKALRTIQNMRFPRHGQLTSGRRRSRDWKREATKLKTEPDTLKTRRGLLRQGDVLHYREALRTLTDERARRSVLYARKGLLSPTTELMKPWYPTARSAQTAG